MDTGISKPLVAVGKLILNVAIVCAWVTMVKQVHSKTKKRCFLMSDSWGGVMQSGIKFGVIREMGKRNKRLFDRLTKVKWKKIFDANLNLVFG